MNATDKLAEAIELAEDAMGYVPEYFVNKHGMNRRMAALKEAFDSERQHAAGAAQPPTIEDINSQSWAGMDGAIAFHLIERHGEDWAHIGRLMQAWLQANNSQQPAPEAAKGVQK